MEEGINLGTIEIPLIKGETGAAGKIVSISVTMLSSTATAYANNTGTEEQAQIVLGIPRGVSITNAEVVSDELILHLDNGTDVNCGNVKGTGISNVTIDEQYNFVVEMTDGSTTIAGNLSDMINQILTDYASKDWVNTQIEQLDIPTKTSDLTNDSDFVTSTDYAVGNKGGVIKTSSGYGLETSATGFLRGISKNYSDYEISSAETIISKGTLENAITGKDLISSTDYATSSTGGTIKIGNGLAINNGIINPQAISGATAWTTSTMLNQFVSVTTARNMINYKIGDIDSALDLINGESVGE